MQKFVPLKGSSGQQSDDGSAELGIRRLHLVDLKEEMPERALAA